RRVKPRGRKRNKSVAAAATKDTSMSTSMCEGGSPEREEKEKARRRDAVEVVNGDKHEGGGQPSSEGGGPTNSEPGVRRAVSLCLHRPPLCSPSGMCLEEPLSKRQAGGPGVMR